LCMYLLAIFGALKDIVPGLSTVDVFYPFTVRIISRPGVRH
jgi:hypothetical protein